MQYVSAFLRLGMAYAIRCMDTTREDRHHTQADVEMPRTRLRSQKTLRGRCTKVEARGTWVDDVTRMMICSSLVALVGVYKQVKTTNASVAKAKEREIYSYFCDEQEEQLVSERAS